MKRIISVLLVIVLCAAVCTVNAGAALPPFQCGDVDWSGEFDSVDVTLTQRYLANMIEDFYEPTQKPMADFDHDWTVTVLDVTWMQRSLAHYTIPEYIGGDAEYDFEITGFSASYDSGKAMVGVPVTLSAEAQDRYHPDGFYSLLYEFSVNGEPVQELSMIQNATVTFDKAGIYALRVRVYNWQGFSREYNIYSYQVVENSSSDEISFKSVRFKELDGLSYFPTLITEAMGGTAPYSYSLKIYHADHPDYGDSCLYSLTDEDISNINAYLADHPDPSWSYGVDEWGKTYLYRDFAEAEETQWCMDMFVYAEGYQIVVQAKDAQGSLSPTEQISYCNAMRMG